MTDSKIQTPTMDQIFGRLILAIFPVGAFVALGLGLQTTDAFAWYVTALVMSTMTFIQFKLLGARIDGPTPGEISLGARFQHLGEALDDVPWLRQVNKSTLFHVIMSLIFGIVGATFEQLLAAGLFSQVPKPYDTALSLFLVLSASYFIEGTFRAAHRYESSEWFEKLKTGVNHALGVQARELNPSVRTLIAAVIRAALSVIVRILAMLILPSVFGNGWMVAFVVLAAMGLIAGYDQLPPLSRTVAAATKPMTSSTRPETNESAQ
jgi:hypothetical protein